LGHLAVVLLVIVVFESGASLASLGLWLLGLCLSHGLLLLELLLLEIASLLSLVVLVIELPVSIPGYIRMMTTYCGPGIRSKCKWEEGRKCWNEDVERRIQKNSTRR
jgi:hypothetical protein